MKRNLQNINVTAAIIILAVAITFSHCVKDKAPIECHLPKTVSFSKDIKPIFNEHCAVSGCHSSGSIQGNLDLSPSVAYSQLFARYEIDTINPTHSRLYYRMNTFSNPMPPSGKLDYCAIQMVLKWIEQKAKNN